MLPITPQKLNMDYQEPSMENASGQMCLCGESGLIAENIVFHS